MRRARRTLGGDPFREASDTPTAKSAPTTMTDEIALVNELLAAEGAIRQQVIEDLTWAMVNSAEFVFQNYFYKM